VKKIKKTVFTLSVDDYAPEITSLTFPHLKFYADRIGADFCIISDRKWPDMPPVYEKLQIQQLAKDMDNDWNIFFDADTLVHPETIDFTNYIGKDTVLHNGTDMAAVRWRYDEYFLRDGRNIGSCNWCTIASDWCLDLWTPLDIPFEQALDNIRATVYEKNTIISDCHLIDDYTLSRNIARYGLKHETIVKLLPRIGLGEADFFFHVYTIPAEEKVKLLKETIKNWKL
jgi:hypothetical protein